MGLKRKIDEDTDDIQVDEAKKRQVEDILKSAPSTSSGSTTEREAMLKSKRQMQGQSAEGGLHSIDSDDEEEYEKSKKIEELDDDDIEGMEDESKVDREGDIQITPFNMKDEKEDGFVTKDGNFVFHKKKEEIRDSWLDNVDWGKVRERTEAEVTKQDEDDEKEMEAEAKYSEIECFREIVEMIKPKETVAKALIRLGGGKKTTAQKLKEKKRQKEGKETDEEKQRREDVAKLIGLADTILTRSGHMEIYEETHESIAYKIKQEESKAPKIVIPEDMDDDDALDMFLDKTDEKKSPEVEKEKQPDMDSEKNTVPLSDDVSWEYKWKDKESDEVHGPFSSSEMLKWQESGFFAKGVFVRKSGSTNFTDGKRIDFDLYV